MGENNRGIGLWLVLAGVILLLISTGFLQWDFVYNFEFWQIVVPVLLISWGLIALFGN